MEGRCGEAGSWSSSSLTWSGACGWQEDFGPPIPVIHFSQASGPVVVCVGLRRCSDEDDGMLERNVKSLGLTEGLDLWYFL
jgi:hypothetical protein